MVAKSMERKLHVDHREVANTKAARANAMRSYSSRTERASAKISQHPMITLA
jgi:hypothetical protein